MAAFVVWLRDQIPATEEGKQQWQQLVEWMNAPPVAAARSLSQAPRRTLRPPGAPADAPVTPAAEAAAFAASMGGT